MSTAPSAFGSVQAIMLDLFGVNTVSNKEDLLIKALLQRYRQILQNKLRAFVDVLPYAPSSITEDLNQACNLLVEMEWHRLKTHWDDVKAARDSFNLVWDSIVENLKAIPTQRTIPVSVKGDFASNSQLMQNIPFMTDANGQIVDGF